MSLRTGFAVGLILGTLQVGLNSAALADYVVDVRSLDGSGNNLANPAWGASVTAMPRIAEANYPGDGSGSVFYGSPGIDTDLPNPRMVSNLLYDTGDKFYANSRRLTNMVWQWGQFLDHDITLVETDPSPTEFAPILTSAGDPMSPLIPFQRSEHASGTGTSGSNPREHVNSITSYIDASNVYGSDATRAAALRDLGNGGRMKTSVGDLLPFNTMGLDNAGGPDPAMFVGGDVRANEQTGLLAMHTLFVREHNRLAGLLSIDNPTWNDEQLYQTARKIVGAQMQVITYNEFLPALLGKRRARRLSPRRYEYDSSIDASVTNEFAASIYRFGHSMLPESLTLAEIPGREADSISMLESFFNPGLIASDATGATQNMDQVLLGLSSTLAQQVDTKMADGVREFLFGLPGSGGMDLAALNIHRGRDHGLPSYNDMREAYGLDPVDSFWQITRDRKVRRKLRYLYGSVDEIDAWVGGLAEDHVWGGSMGELLTTAIMDQFTDLRDGDRYFYSGDDELMNNPSVSAVIDLDDLSLADIISWNTSLEEVPDDVFRLRRRGVGRFFDGFEDFFDRFGRFQDRFGSFAYSSSGGGGIFSVPEPGTGLLASLGLGLLAYGRRRN